MEIVKQRAQVRKELTLLNIARSSFQNEVRLFFWRFIYLFICFSKGFLGFYRGYFATLSREIPFSMIQFPLWEFFKVNSKMFVFPNCKICSLQKTWREKQGGYLSPFQGAICGSIAGGIAASITTPLGKKQITIKILFQISSFE